MGRHRRPEGITSAALGAATVIGGGVDLTDGSDSASAATWAPVPDSGGSGGHELDDATFGSNAGSGTTIDVTGHSGSKYSLTIRK
ncbi:hypothetical protein ACIRYZ_19000 [Kitasatospora sp. NPDC101155]|uniref:hypothetical protein n=1 Tax=Kitasatospora sp. NPDC101155 TaxID=3364097 RepID=UPI003808D1D5